MRHWHQKSMKPIEIHCTDVDDLREKVKQQLFSGTAIFRGVSKPNYELISSFSRIIEDRPIDHNSAAETVLFSEALKKDGITPTPNQYANLPDLLPRLAHLQHHGVPTRLLDWTESLDVAIYFAVRSLNGANSASIFATDLARFRILDDNISKAAELDIWSTLTPAQLFFCDRPMEMNWFRISPGLVPRLDRQQGLFLVPGNPYHSFLENVYSSTQNTIPDNIIYKYVLPTSDEIRNGILRDLDSSVKINKTELFPGGDYDSIHFKDLALRVIDAISSPDANDA